VSHIPPTTALRGGLDLSSLVNRTGSGPTGVHPSGSGASVSSEVVAVRRLVMSATDATFAEYLELSMAVPVVVLLSSSRGDHGAALEKSLTQTITALEGRLVLVLVDVDASPQLAHALQAQTTPTVAAVVGGRPVVLFQGDAAVEQIRDVLDQLLQLAASNGVTGVAQPAEESTAPTAEQAEESLPPHHQEARDAIARRDYGAALAHYREAVAQNPSDDRAVVGIAQVSVLARLDGKSADEIRSSAAAAPNDLDVQLAVVDLDVSGGHIDDAFDRLLGLFSGLEASKKDAVRARLLDLMLVVGRTDPRVVRARARLTTLLY